MQSAWLPRRRRLRTVQCIVLLLSTLVSIIYFVWPQGPVSSEYSPRNQPGVNSHRYYAIRDHSVKDRNIKSKVLYRCPPNMAKKIPQIFTLFVGNTLYIILNIWFGYCEPHPKKQDLEKAVFNFVPQSRTTHVCRKWLSMH